MHNTPLFVPLRGNWYDRFAAGLKTDEWRRYGSRWNETTCYVGRPVHLVRGYSGRRLQATIARVTIRHPETEEQIEFFGNPETKCLVLGLVDIRPHAN